MVDTFPMWVCSQLHNELRLYKRRPTAHMSNLEQTTSKGRLYRLFNRQNKTGSSFRCGMDMESAPV